MKKIFNIAIFLMPFILFSCFEFVGSGTAKRTLQLALAAPSDVAKLHIAVFDGIATENRLLYKDSVAAGSSIPLDLPAGDNRIVVVWAEGFSGNANYYGYTPPISIVDDGLISIPIRMKKFSIADNSAFNINYSDPDLGWDIIPGSVTYQLDYVPFNGTDTITIITPTTIYNIPFGINSARVRVFSSVFGIGSEWSPYI